MVTKIVKKASHFWKHGKHASIPARLLAQPAKRRKEKTYESVKDLMKNKNRI